jgi:hypothetical protein
MKHVPSALFVSLFCASTAVSAAGTAAPSNALDKFIGSGSCAGNVMAMGKNPGHATVGKYHGEKIMDGRWAEIRYDEDQSAANPKPFHVVQYFGYDTSKKRYVSVLIDNADESYSTGTSPGWQGDSITFDESSDGKSVSFRDVFTSGRSGMSSHTGWMKDKNGKWVKTDEESCKSS